MFDSTIAILSRFHEGVIPNAEAITTKKTIKRKKYLHVINILNESIGATKITKRIMDLDINLIVGELLASASVVEKQLAKGILENKVV